MAHVDFLGIRYWRDKSTGYYGRTEGQGAGETPTKAYLHRRMWENARGPIPGGFHIHHKDGDKEHHGLWNLECVSASEHGKRHDNLAGHRYDWANQPARPKVCEQCGAEYGARAPNARWCSKSCGVSARHAAGDYDETKTCVVCSTDFRVRKWRTTRTCSPKCRWVYREANRQAALGN